MTRVPANQTLHGRIENWLRRANQDVKVIRHEAVRVDLNTELTAHFAQQGEKGESGVGGQKRRLAVRTTVHHVVRTARRRF